MSILVRLKGWDENKWKDLLSKEFLNRRIYISKDDYEMEEIEYVVVWKPEPELLKKLPNLKVIFNAGAGVDFLLRQSNLPDVPIVRVVPDDLIERMIHYILFNVLFHHRKMFDIQEAQKNQEWISVDQPSAIDIRIGVLGLGMLGKKVVRMLSLHGYNVKGWSRTKKEVNSISTFYGIKGLDEITKHSDILISLLPATKQTKGILNYNLFSMMPKNGVLGGAVLINCGRGNTQVESDILKAIENKVLIAASLDVFEIEPLPRNNELWYHPRILVTPHNAATSDAASFVSAIATQIKMYEKCGDLMNVVNLDSGY